MSILLHILATDKLYHYSLYMLMTRFARRGLIHAPLQCTDLPSLDSHTIVLAMHVCVIANSSSVCFSQGCFLRHVRRPRVLGWSLIGSAGC